MVASSRDLEERILILAPTGRDSHLVADALNRSQLQAEVVLTATLLCKAVEEGAGAILIAEEALSAETLVQLSDALRRQPAWSDLPVVIFAVPASSEAASTRLQRMLDDLGNVTTLERPFRIATLLTTVRAALRARARQYAARMTLQSLERQETALKRADQRKDEFLAMLAHELRNPLAALGMSLALMESEADEGRHSARHREMARRQMRNLVRLVDDLLDVSRITRGIVELRRERVELGDILHAAVAAAQPALDARQHRLRVETEPGEFPVFADATRLEQVITNLLSNAAKYTPANGQVTVELRRELRDGHPVAAISVADSGRGIPRDMLERVFEQFVQVDQTLDRSMGGLGLGLTLVKALAEMHGGTVQAGSAGPNQGSEFTVRIPLTSEVETRSDAPIDRQHEAVSGGARRVVLVEDSEDIREGMQEYLEALGHEVMVAADGAVGVQTLLHANADIAFVDIGLPVLDGYEVARRVRSAPEGRAIMLVALTGYGGSDSRALALEAGFDLHLTKPVAIADLPAIIARSRAGQDKAPIGAGLA